MQNERFSNIKILQIMEKLSAAEKYSPEIVATADGSHTLFIPALGEHYHSFHSSVREAVHVYIEAGLHWLFPKTPGPIRVFEVGFGSGLNALVTALAANEAERKVEFHSVELYPLEAEQCLKLNYCQYIESPKAQTFFDLIHSSPWENDVSIHPFFSLQKLRADFLQMELEFESVHIIYFDAFGFRAQEELWQLDVFEKCFRLLKPGGVLVTYASKGVVRRTMQQAGFAVDKLPGPPGKREMVRATKPA
jgi:tRNA U34 5-methylaminomethyl-2-thiouridine-forming methyltransferase MnmC